MGARQEPIDDSVPISDLYTERHGMQERESFQRLIASQTPLIDSLEDQSPEPIPPVTDGGGEVKVDMSPEWMNRTADQARVNMPEPMRRERLMGNMKRQSFRDMVNKTMGTVTGGVLSLDAIDAHIRAEMEGLPSPLAATLKSKEVLSLLDPAGNVMTALTREQLKREGLMPNDLADQIADGVGLAVSVLTPPGALKAVAGKRAAKLGTEIFMTSLFSNPASHTANIGSNMLTSMWSIPERFAAAGYEALAWGATLGTHERQVFFGESGAMLYGAVTALTDAVREAGYTLRTGESRLPNILEDMSYHQKLAEAKKVVGEAEAAKIMAVPGQRARDPKTGRFTSKSSTPFNEQPGLRAPLEETVMGQGMGFWSMLWRSPMRALGAEDVAFKVINRNMEIYAQAYREAAQSGDLSFKSIRALVANPGEEILSRADQFATVTTFQRKINELGPVFKQMGALGQDIQDFSIANIPLGRLVVPVMRTPLNLAHFTLERSPILNMFLSTYRADLAAGGALRAQAIGKMAGGVTLASTMMYFGASGIITGGGPADPELRRQKSELSGWQPYSIKIGDTYYSYDRLSPLGSILGLVADATEIGGSLSDYHMKTLAQAIAVSVAHNLTSKTFLEGAADLFGASTGDEKAFGRLTQSLISVTTPGIMRGATKVVDPYKREVNPGADPEQGSMGELRGLINRYKAQVPGWSSYLPPQRNLWGDAIEIPAGWHPDWLSPVFRSFSPVSAQAAKKDPAGDEIVRLTRAGLMSVGRASRSILGSDPDAQPPGVPPNPLDLGIKLTDTEYDDYVKLAGNELKSPQTGLGMHDAMNEFIANDPRYKQTANGKPQTDAAKATYLTNIVSGYRQAAVAALLQKHEGLREAYTEHLNAMGDALRGERKQ